MFAGDFAPARLQFTILHFTVILIGLALISMSTKIIQENIEKAMQRRVIQIQTEYKDRMLRGETYLDELDDDEAFKRFQHQHGGWLNVMMSKRQQHELKNAFLLKARMRVKGIRLICFFIWQQKNSLLEFKRILFKILPFVQQNSS